MIFITSPAKTLDFETHWESVLETKPLFLDKASQVAGQLRKLKQTELAKVLNVSEALADVNFKRYKSWKKVAPEKNTKPAILAYRGDIYREMQASLYTEEQQRYAQESFRILSGLYGLLRPYDLILPYRLEMNAPVTVEGAKNLYDFWSKDLTKQLQKDLEKDSYPLLLNCASNEYSKALNFGEITVPWFTLEFKQEKNGKLENVGIFAKKARGMMVEHLIRSRATDLETVKQFRTQGYQFHSEKEHLLVFARQAIK